MSLKNVSANTPRVGWSQCHQVKRSCRAGETRAAQALDGLAARVSPALQFCPITALPQITAHHLFIAGASIKPPLAITAKYVIKSIDVCELYCNSGKRC